jgi:hypothetical protein
MMVLADKRYNSTDKRGNLPQWISEHIKDAHLNMSTDMVSLIYVYCFRPRPTDALCLYVLKSSGSDGS